MFHAEVKTASLPVSRFLAEYCRPEQFCPLCHDCPDYGRVWSCPPGVPEARETLSGYQSALLIGVKVFYDPSTRAKAVSPEAAELLRQATYGKVKRGVLESLLLLQQTLPDSYLISAGRCELCERCARMDGQPCIKPQSLRYSFSAFGFDLSRISRELLDTPLLWDNQGLPEYNMAIYAYLTRD